MTTADWLTRSPEEEIEYDADTLFGAWPSHPTDTDAAGLRAHLSHSHIRQALAISTRGALFDAASGNAETIAAAGDLNEAYIRILLTRGVGDLNYDPKSTPTPTTVIIVKPFEPPAPRVFQEGIRISLVEMLRNHPQSVNPRIKSNNLLNNAMAMQAAYRAGAEEGLMCNYRGELTECSQANFFLVRGEAVLTPPTDAGLLEGVTRAFIFELGRELGIDVREETLLPKDLADADEMFITSTTRELSPVVNIDGRVVGSGSPGPITKRLLARYQARANEMTCRPKAAATK